jgi:hypothetical protein
VSDFTGQVQITDELILREVQYRGALQLARLLQDRVYNPDFYTLEKSEDYGAAVIDRDADLYDLREVVKEIRLARVDGSCHLCIQAHWLLSGGKGEASITLVLDD